MGEVPNVLGKNAEQPSVGLENIVACMGSDGQDVESTESNKSSECLLQRIYMCRSLDLHVPYSNNSTTKI